MSDKAVGRIRFIAACKNCSIGKEYEIYRFGDTGRFFVDDAGVRNNLVFYDRLFERVAPAPEKQPIAVGDLAEERHSRIVDGSTQFLSQEAQNDYDAFLAAGFDDGGCTCFISPPCSYCVHPGNPHNFNEDDDAWELSKQVHLGAGIFVTQADHAALQKMEKANNICLCGRFVGRTRINAGLPDCTYCSAAAVRKQAVAQKLVRRGLDLEKANKIAFAGLTAHLREVKA